MGVAEGQGSLALTVSRRPIFDREKMVRAYDLGIGVSAETLAKWLLEEAGPGQEGSFLESLTGGRPALVRLKPESVLQGLTDLFPEGWLIWPRIDRTTRKTDLLAAARRVKEVRRGLVLDLLATRVVAELAELADVVSTDLAEARKSDPDRLAAHPQASTLARGIIREEEFEAALGLGFDLFEGSFYREPVFTETGAIPQFRTSLIRLLAEINSPEMDYAILEELVSQDVALAYKLLRYINSPYFGLRVEVKSLGQAMALLGEREIRKWVSLAAVSEAAGNKPDELVVLSLVRSLFMAELADLTGLAENRDDLALIGLFSLLEAFFDQPMTALLDKIPFQAEIRAALLNMPGPYLPLVQLALAYERGDWGAVNQGVIELGLDKTGLLKAFHRAVTGSQRFFQAG